MKTFSISLCLFFLSWAVAFGQTAAEKAKKSADGMVRAIDATIKNAEIAKKNMNPDPKLFLNASQKDAINKAYLNYNLGLDTFNTRKAELQKKAADMNKMAEDINAKSAALKAKAEAKPETEEETNALNEEIRKGNEEIEKMKGDLDKMKTDIKNEQEALKAYPEELKNRRDAQIEKAMSSDAQKKAYQDIKSKKG